MRLQHFLLSKLDKLKSLTRGKPTIIAFVVMEPSTGRILSMAGFDDRPSPDINPCTLGKYPAASIFKLITASAAVETFGYNSNTIMSFSGRKYTLYKSQLEAKKKNNKVPFDLAFAQSINPIFGMLGSKELGGSILYEYAKSFGFNQSIDSDINFNLGSVAITKIPYQWAEVASGFNKTTTISPMFGAMLASTILNSGKTPIPCLVETITDDKGNLLYQRKNQIAGIAIKPKTAKTIMKMMNKTVSKGTARKSFKGFQKDAVLSKLNLGGKTGSLYNKNRTVKFDWFAGFGKTKKGKKQIALAIVVGHGKYIGTKASFYGKMIFKEYFDNYFASTSSNINKS